MDDRLDRPMLYEMQMLGHNIKDQGFFYIEMGNEDAPKGGTLGPDPQSSLDPHWQLL